MTDVGLVFGPAPGVEWYCRDRLGSSDHRPRAEAPQRRFACIHRLRMATCGSTEGRLNKRLRSASHKINRKTRRSACEETLDIVNDLVGQKLDLVTKLQPTKYWPQ
jgi:hypothetical protein